MTRTYRLTLIASVFTLWCVVARSASAQAAFSVVLIPDTQNYSEFSSYEVYEHQMQWLVDNRDARNIKFAVHLGDITNHDLASEYDVASAAHSLLDNAGVPYSMTIGNHDIFPSNEAYKRSSLYANYFGQPRYQGELFYGGAYDASNMNNYTYFEAGGLKFMVVSLEFAPRKDVVTWANQVIANHPDRRVIVATHCHMDNNAEHASGCADGYNLEGRVGVDLWEELIQRHSNVFMSVSGHIQGVSYRRRTGNNGNIIHEILNDFQNEPVLGNGHALGNGWLRVLTFSPAQNQITVQTLSVEDGNCAIFANCQATLYLNYNQASSPTATKHNEQNYTVSYDMQSAMPAYGYKANDILFKDRMANVQLTGKHFDPKIATAPSGNFVVVWEDDHDDNGVGQIYARGFDPDGNARFSQIAVNSVDAGQQQHPDVAIDDSGRFVVVWEDDQDGNGAYQVLARGFDANGSERFHDRTVNTVSGGQQSRPAVACDANGNFVVAWEDDQDGNGYYQILARGFTAAGAERIPTFTVNSVAAGEQFNPVIAMDSDGDFVVAWEDDQDDDANFQIYHRGFTATGGNRFAQKAANTNAAGQHTKPSIGMANNGNYVVAWEDDQDANGYYQIYARGFTITGVERFGVMTVNSVADGQQYAPSVGMRGDGAFAVVWQDDQDDNGVYQILGRDFTSSGAQNRADFTVNSDASGQQRLPVTAVDDQGRFVVAWEDDMDGNGKALILARNLNY
ncbi:metallophosphoesterase [Sorangium sp. So ce1078]|uniref:metallophosphoesterase n=1 Tax=Sorangium sp. So ce1078 TaxID=3133329 RepID=UPI003F5D5896